jgi:hypothetical protein
VILRLEMGDDDLQLGGWQSPLTVDVTVGGEMAAGRMCSGPAVRVHTSPTLTS